MCVRVSEEKQRRNNRRHFTRAGVPITKKQHNKRVLVQKSECIRIPLIYRVRLFLFSHDDCLTTI